MGDLVVRLFCALWGFSSTPGLYPLDVSRFPHPPKVSETKQCLQTLPGVPGAKLPLMRTSNFHREPKAQKVRQPSHCSTAGTRAQNANLGTWVLQSLSHNLMAQAEQPNSKIQTLKCSETQHFQSAGMMLQGANATSDFKALS